VITNVSTVLCAVFTHIAYTPHIFKCISYDRCLLRLDAYLKFSYTVINVLLFLHYSRIRVNK